MRSIYAEVLYKDASSTLGDLRESVETLEDTARTARRVLGGAHPFTKAADQILQEIPGRHSCLRSAVEECVNTKTYEARVARIVDAVVSSLRRCAGLR